MKNAYELTVIMPCLNEAETLEICINKALKCMKDNNVLGEVLIADNGSNDGSIEIAKKCGARVANIPNKGYGSALIGGTLEAKGKYCIMGDADDSYDFSNLMPYLKKLREGYDLVMGNRFKGGIEKGAMPFLHRYLGTPVISFLGRLFYKNKIGDFNCGMRGYNTQRIKDLKLRCTGMEYASEMIVQCALNDYKIAEVPTTLSVDGRSRKPYLSTWSDGWRHLKFLLLHSPNWLFLIPGIILSTIGVLLFVLTGIGPVKVGNISLDINTMLFSSAFVIVGINTIMFSWYTKIYANTSNYIPVDKTIAATTKRSSEKIIITGLILFLLGITISIIAFVLWGTNGFGNLDPTSMLRLTIPAATCCILGFELIFSGFFTGILQIEHK